MIPPDDYAPAGPMDRIRARIAARRPWWRRLADQMKTADPGMHPGAAEPTGCKEPKDMHTVHAEQFAQGRQIAAALALAHIRETGPVVDAEWRITRDGDLHGHVDMHGRDTEARRAIDHFAEFLGAPVSGRQGHGQLTEWTHLSADGVYRGVPITVWTHVEVRPYDGSALA